MQKWPTPVHILIFILYELVESLDVLGGILYCVQFTDKFKWKDMIGRRRRQAIEEKTKNNMELQIDGKNCSSSSVNNI